MKSNQVLIPVIRQMADFGTTEPFVARVSLGLTDLLSGLSISEAAKKEANDQIFEIFQELSHAFISLRDVNDMESGKKEMLLVNQKKAYQDFYSYCWTSYKDRMPKLLQILGIDIGFLFGNEKTFNVGAEKFKELYPDIGEEFIKMVGNDRASWQNTVSKIRNDYIEHKKGSVSDDVMKSYFNQKAAQLIFDNCWQAIEDIVVMCMSTKLFNGIKIGLIPEKEIDKSCPKKFCFYMTNNEK
jgi:hypothetical protein